jgi:hypothetical protein
MGAVRLVLEIDDTGDPGAATDAGAVTGRVCRSGEWLAFEGWTELGAAIVRLAAEPERGPSLPNIRAGEEPVH